MDLQIADLDGLRAAAAIRARERGAWRTPIVGMSASADVAADRERCLAAGMDDVFPKPIDLTALAEAVQRWTLGDGRAAEPEAEENEPARPVPVPLTVVSSHFDAPERPGAAGSGGAPSTDGPAIDVETLNQSSMGLPALRHSMLQTYLSDVFPRLHRLEDAIERRDLERTEFEAHGLRGMCSTIGAAGCAWLFGQIEDRARDRQWSGISSLLPLAVEQVKRSEEFIARLERIVTSEAA